MKLEAFNNGCNYAVVDVCDGSGNLVPHGEEIDKMLELDQWIMIECEEMSEIKKKKEDDDELENGRT